jgi:hypothetical protein
MKPLTKRNKRFFSLIELMATFILMTIVVVAIIYPGKRAIDQKRFDLSVATIVNRMNIAKQVAFNYDTHVQLVVEKQNNELVCNIIAEDGVKHILKELIKPVLLKGVEGIFANDSPVDKLVIDYFSKLGIQNPIRLEIRSFVDKRKSFEVY